MKAMQEMSISKMAFHAVLGWGLSTYASYKYNEVKKS